MAGVKWLICLWFLAFPSRLQNGCCSSRHHIQVKGKRKGGRKSACNVFFFFFKSGKQKLSWKASSRFLPRSDSRDSDTSSCHGNQQERRTGEEWKQPVIPQHPPHPLSTPPPRFTAASPMSFLPNGEPSTAASMGRNIPAVPSSHCRLGSRDPGPCKSSGTMPLCCL